MARKLEDREVQTTNTHEHSLVGRRDYVKAGMLSTLAGTGLVSSSIPVSAGSSNSIHFVGVGKLATYEFTVSGTLTDSDDTPFDARRNISGPNAEGTVHHSIHGYRYDGELLDIRIEGDATVYRNHQPLSRSEISNR